MRVLTGVAGVISLVFASCAVDDGMPFGRTTETDEERLVQFARTKGFDLRRDMEFAYWNDTRALARVFQFSTTFTRLDRNARTYGQIIYSSFLTLGESNGVPAYAQVINAQTPPVQQRVRDFLYYPMRHVSKRQLEKTDRESRLIYNTLFPPTFHFSRNDPVF